MTKGINIISKGISLIFMALAAVFMLWLLYAGDNAIKGDLGLQDRLLNPFLYTAYIALALAVVLAIFFSFVNLIVKPKNLVKMLIIVGVMVVLAFVTYSMAGNDFDALKLKTLKTTAETSKQVGAALYYTYIIGAVAIVVTIFSSIINLFK